MLPLPIDSSLPEIINQVREHRTLVLVAPPGAGKTTRVPPALLRAGLLSAEYPNLVMLQPRRVAARAAAARIAEENAWEVGGEVGYQVRFERRIGPRTRLRVITEGILTRQLLADPFLEGVGAVLLDEFHERSLHTDLAAAMLGEVRQTVRPDLILIVMSATLAAEPIAHFLGDCPIVRTEGRVFPVEIEHLPAGAAAPRRGELADSVAGALERSLSTQDDPGDVLVFLPGVEEIRRTMRRLEDLAARHDLLLLPLHGSLGAEKQMAALRPAGRRKIVLATNIAETSLTIDGVRTVIDSGLARVAGFDPRRGMDRLELKRISLASATQRSGRAGRTAPGRCLRLWPKSQERAMAAFELPEVRRVDLCATVLTLHEWGKTDPRSFAWFELPDERMLAAAERSLAMLGALDREESGSITPLGRRLLELPVHPRIGRLMVGAAEAGLLIQGATLAALIEEKDILQSPAPEVADAGARFGRKSPTTSGPSDLLHRMQLFSETEKRGFRTATLGAEEVNVHAARQVAWARDELMRIGRRLDLGRAGEPSNEEEALLRLVLLAYPDRVARRRGSAGSAVMVGGSGIRVSPESVARQAEVFVAVDAREDERSVSREATVRIASAIDPVWLEELFPASIRKVRELVFDPRRERVVGRGAVFYRDLLLREDLDASVDPELAGPILAEALRLRAEEIFAGDPAAAFFLGRVKLLRQAMPEYDWPAFDRRELESALAEACRGKRSLEEVRSLAQILQAALTYPLLRILEQQAPETLSVPSGNRIRLDYAASGRVVLAARLQELFGWTDTPKIAAGRVTVVVHLLGPNYRPVQITEDLRSFWSTTYFQVRKDLRMRYPKHSWPEDPLTAKAAAKGRRNV